MNYEGYNLGGLGILPGEFDFNLPSFKEISGKLIDITTNLPIGAAHIYIKDQVGGGTTTNEFGEFNMTVNSTAIYVFSHISYGQLEIKGDQIGSITYMEPQAQELDEIVLTGTNKKKYTGLKLAGLSLLAFLIYRGVNNSNVVKTTV